MPKTDIHSFTKNDFELVNRQVVYDEGIFRMAKYIVRHKLFKGDWCAPYTREVMERSSAAAVLPYNPITDEVILIQQFRAGSVLSNKSPWLLEIVAGIFDKESETPEQMVMREAEEEAGCKINRLHLISEYFVSPGGCNEYLQLYVGQVDTKHEAGNYGVATEHEDIRSFTLPLSEALELVANYAILTSPAIISLLWLQINKERLLKLWQVK